MLNFKIFIPKEPISITSGEEIDFSAVFKILLNFKYVIIASSILCGVIAVFYALTATEIFRGETVVSEISEAGGSGLGGAAAIASQFGIGLGTANSGGNNTAPPARAILKSRNLAEEFIKRYNLQSEILGTNPMGSKKSPWFAVKLFREEIMFINEDLRSGLITVRIDWTDPIIASRWANDFVALTNELIRNRALEDAKRNIAYLNEQIEQTNIVELQKIMYNLIENETQTVMMANARAEYAFAVVDPAVPPESRHSPARTAIVLFGGVLGFFIGIIVSFLYNMQLKRNNSIASERM